MTNWWSGRSGWGYAWAANWRSGSSNWMPTGNQEQKSARLLTRDQTGLVESLGHCNWSSSKLTSSSDCAGWLRRISIGQQWRWGTGHQWGKEVGCCIMQEASQLRGWSLQKASSLVSNMLQVSDWLVAEMLQAKWLRSRSIKKVFDPHGNGTPQPRLWGNFLICYRQRSLPVFLIRGLHPKS